MSQNTKRRILVFNCHEAWVYQLSHLKYDLDIITGLSGLYKLDWDTHIRPIPQNGRLIDLEQAQQYPNRYDCIITNNITDLMDVKHRNEPKILILHLPIKARQVLEQSKISSKDIIKSLHQYINMIGAHVVSVSKFKGKSWGFTEDIIPFGIDANEYLTHEGNRPEGLRICNFALERQQFLLWDLHKKAFKGLPIQIIGHNPGMKNIYASHSWDHLKHLLQIHRFYIHTADILLEDGYNMATIEAMAAGMPILGNIHPSSPVKHGISGFLSNDPLQLRKYAQILLTNQQLALQMGQEAQKTAQELFSINTFIQRFEQAIRTAQRKHTCTLQRNRTRYQRPARPSIGIISLGAKSRKRPLRQRKITAK